MPGINNVMLLCIQCVLFITGNMIVKLVIPINSTDVEQKNKIKQMWMNGPGLDWDHLGALPFQAGRGPWTFTVKWQHISVGGSRGMTPWKYFEFWVSKTAFPAFWGHFWAKYKGLKWHFLTAYRAILKKYFCWNKIRHFALHRTQAWAVKISFYHPVFSY